MSLVGSGHCVYHNHLKKYRADNGKMAEWAIASVLKIEGLKGLGGSNPSLSARNSDLVLLETIYSSYL